MRLLLLLCLGCTAAFAAAPAELAEALKKFSGDPPKGWSFTQTTAGEGKSTVERCDAAKPEFDRWALVQKDGHAPTDDEAKEYFEMRSRRSRGGTAPKLTDQFDLTTLETVSDSPERAMFRLRLKTGEAGDKTAEFLQVTLLLHKTTRTLESIELANVSEFSPTWGVKIAEMKTTMSYNVPTADQPSLPQLVTTRLRGRAFYFKSLDADLTVKFTDYERVGKK
jgi:hypothetical protein